MNRSSLYDVLFIQAKCHINGFEVPINYAPNSFDDIFRC